MQHKFKLRITVFRVWHKYTLCSLNLGKARPQRASGVYMYINEHCEQGQQRSINSNCEGYIAGVDESGRGPLAGPVFASAVILDPTKPIVGLADCKLLSAKKREQLSLEIEKNCLAFSVGRAEVDEIDRINIFQASLLAMQRAIETLQLRPQSILVDGTHCPQLSFAVTEMKAIIGGDNLIPAISAASIIAKVMRDHEMQELDKLYPLYGFATHKGYGTKQHLQALKRYGACPIHRRSFAPVKFVINN